jgi:hypothetical protein
MLSLPYRPRYLLAWDHALARAVLGGFVRVRLGFQRHRRACTGQAYFVDAGWSPPVASGHT